MISVAKSSLRAAEAKVRRQAARIASAKAGVKRADASYSSLGVRVQAAGDAGQPSASWTFRCATRPTASSRRPSPHATKPMAMVSETTSAHEQAVADRERAEVDVESARAELQVAEAEERDTRVLVEYGKIKAPYDGVITQRNVSPGDYLQPGGGSGGRPLFVLEQTDPLRVFVGVPELASFYIHPGDTATIRLQAISGATREGKVVRSAFSLDASTRTLQTEIDIDNSDGHLHPGWYVTVSIAIERKQVWTLPSQTIGLGGPHNSFVFLEVDGKPVRTPVIIGPSDDTHTEVLRKYSSATTITNDWPELDGTERVLSGSLEILGASKNTTDAAAGAKKAGP